MLAKLSIKNYALIRDLEISPSSALNIITGETGAGKSIMLGALGLLLGNRADTKALLSKDSKCIIEGEFQVADYQLESIFEEADLDYEDQTIIRREINPKGKSRAFINDMPTTLDTLMRIGLKLLDIHSQNESIQIAKKETRLKLIDDYAQNESTRNKYESAYTKYLEALKNLEKLRASQADIKKEESYNNFLLDELTKADLSHGEQEELESEIKILDNSEDIKVKLSQIIGEFQESDFSVSDKLSEMYSALSSIDSYSSELEKLSERFSSCLEELKDVVGELNRVLDSVEHDPARIEEINQRLSLLYQLQQKHGVDSVDSLLAIQGELEEKVSTVQNLEKALVDAQSAFDKCSKILLQKGAKLSKSRTSVLSKFSDDMNKLLDYVGIPDGKLEMRHTEIPPTSTGIDKLEMLFSANKGVTPQPVGQVASGGEFSRLMLCIKYLLASKTAMPTVIFDEIDTGVSGEIAKKMAIMMKKMAQNHQIIAISHLPQIAAKGDAHYYVYKNNRSETAESLIKKLTPDDHIQEVAKMIGGLNPSEAAIKNAKELIAG
ncbi:MAG: DNA repair protein RecN [Cyclobacteriaceae bacterium]